MAVRRMSSIIAVLLVIAISGFFVLCSECQVDAMVDPSPTEEQAKTVAASGSSNTQTDTTSGTKKSKQSQILPSLRIMILSQHRVTVRVQTMKM